jgi:hypothetical protein
MSRFLQDVRGSDKNLMTGHRLRVPRLNTECSKITKNRNNTSETTHFHTDRCRVKVDGDKDKKTAKKKK